jgi:hypothetical protein
MQFKHEAINRILTEKILTGDWVNARVMGVVL